MKKVFNELLLIVLLLFVVSLNTLCLLSGKVKFLDIGVKASMSTDKAEEVFEELDGVVVRCKMKYNDFTYSKVISKELSDVDEIRTEKKEIKEAGKKYHYNKNCEITKDIGDLGYEYCYVSEYSPYVENGFTHKYFFSKTILHIRRIFRYITIFSLCGVWFY